MTKREYGAIALGVMCFVLLSALLVLLEINSATAIFVALLAALEVGWLYRAPQHWVQAHTVTVPIFRHSLMRGLQRIFGFVLAIVTLCLSFVIITAGMLTWHDKILHLSAWEKDDMTIGFSLTLVLFSASAIGALTLHEVPHRFSARSWKHLATSLLISFGVAIVWPLIPVAFMLIVGALVLWLCAAILIGIALLATEVHLLVVTSSIIIGSLMSLIPGMTEVTPINLILRITLGAIAGFATGEALHRVGEFFAYTKRGQHVAAVIFNRHE